MSLRALIVDDEPGIVRAVSEVVESLGHRFESANDLETAQRVLEARPPDYLILDMNLPLAPGRTSKRRENGRNFLELLRKAERFARLPVVVITGQDGGKSEFILSVMAVGGFGVTEYVQKPLDGDKLDTAIQKLLISRTVSPGTAKATLQPFSAEKREMIIYKDRITLCGVQVWSDHAYPELREVLLMLSVRDKHGYVRVSGTELSRRLKRNASNPITQSIKRFRDTCSEKMETCRNLACGKYDVIGKPTGGGYHLAEHIEVKTDSVQERRAQECIPRATFPGLNVRQQWVLDQIAQGIPINQKEVIKKFRPQYSESTIKRDLSALRRQAIIRSANGCYVLLTSDSRSDLESSPR